MRPRSPKWWMTLEHCRFTLTWNFDSDEKLFLEVKDEASIDWNWCRQTCFCFSGSGLKRRKDFKLKSRKEPNLLPYHLLTLNELLYFWRFAIFIRILTFCTDPVLFSNKLFLIEYLDPLFANWRICQFFFLTRCVFYFYFWIVRNTRSNYICIIIRS